MRLTSPAASSEPARQQPWTLPCPSLCRPPTWGPFCHQPAATSAESPLLPQCFAALVGPARTLQSPVPRTGPAAPLPAPGPRGAEAPVLPSGLEEGQAALGWVWTRGRGAGSAQGRHRAGPSPNPAGGGKESKEQHPLCTRVLTRARASSPLWKRHHRSSVLLPFL